MNKEFLVIQINNSYAKLIGQAVYSFSYYEWMIINIINSLEKGFVYDYSRKQSLTSGRVSMQFKSIIDKVSFPHLDIKKAEMENCYKQFHSLIDKRNALIHGHPITHNGAQMLAYQTKITKPVADIKWTDDELESFIAEINEAILSANKIHENIVLKR